MPIAMEPNTPMRIVLSTDKAKPKEQQPVFLLKYLTVREWRKVAAISDTIDSNKSGTDILDKTISSVKAGLIGWENLKDAENKVISFDIEKLDDILIASEIMELMQALLAQNWRVEDKKKLDSRSQSDSDSSAKPAQA